MAIVEQLDSVVHKFMEHPFLYTPLTIVGLVLAVHIIPWIIDPHGLRKYPGPPLAAFSDLWLTYHCRHGDKYKHVHAAHQKYGKYVRIAPNNLSIADPDAIPVVYGHGTGSLKTEFYDAFVSIRRGLFNTRDRAEHTRKRKIISHTFAQRSVLEFEPYVHDVMRTFLRKWDKYTEEAKKTGGEKKDGYWWIDSLPWFNFLAFDIIGDLAFGQPFGMIEREQDMAMVEDESGNTQALPAVQILNDRGEYSATLGCMPPWMRPIAPIVDPWFSRGAQAVANLAGIARSRVNARLKTGSGDRKDLLTRLQEGKDEKGQKMQKDELTAEALTQLIAGSDTTSNSSCAITFWITKNPRVHKKLVEILDEKFKDVDGVLDYEDVKNVPYLEACINEALRRHSTSSMGLPRYLQKDTQFKEELLSPGTVCSVPAYTLHHLDSIWGDPYEFRPERWLEGDAQQLDKAFVPFSYGPRSCVGRNLATMELLIFIGTLFLRYDFKLQDPNLDELPSAEGFLRKPLYSYIGIKRRETA